MRAELANLNHCAVPFLFLSRTTVNLSWYDSRNKVRRLLRIDGLFSDLRKISYRNNIDVRRIGHLKVNIKTKMLNIEARVPIGWYSLASQSERVPTRCFYVKVAYLSCGEYSNTNTDFCAHHKLPFNDIFKR